MPGQSITDTTIQQISQGLDDGVNVAISGGKLGFYGLGAPIGIQTCTNAAAVSASSTTTVCNTGVAELVAALVALNLIKSA
jgi:hypothetical protein